MSLEPPARAAPPLAAAGGVWLAVALNALSVAPFGALLVLAATDAAQRGVPLAVGVAALGLAAVNYATWELAYGSAFAFFMPLHGAYHVPQRAWLLGTMARASIAFGVGQFVLALAAPVPAASSVHSAGAALFAVLLGTAATLFVVGAAT